ncbi:MAG: cysteine hydrolase [Ardenticatenaceae bacterium]|nr:cysteine hydrolase [Anaerolineales bacterium]MCB8920434.1 cysteine hydrolase [Ardenticatenaceae bacterium]MCB8989389.1 cysteine hydrolase [Ardenticatenaceae bacterium]MCB9004544.1 cysteine hydrolase [Ardenticatenaceae bacterium]
MGQNKALLVLDTQVNMFDDEFHVYDGDRVLEVIGSLAKKARSSGSEVIYVRNNGGSGEPDEPGTPGWEIHSRIRPQEEDVIFDKSSPDAFEGTELQSYLDTQGVQQLIVVGMQTEMCVAKTCKKAVALGHKVTLVADGHTTFDWEEMTAVDAITQHNAELSKLADIKPATEVEF